MSPLNALDSLLGDYLHEDYKDLYGSAWEAVATYTRCEPERAPKLRSEITEILQTYPAEADLEPALDLLGLCYLPTADGWESHRDWLLAIADRVDEILRSSPAGQATE